MLAAGHRLGSYVVVAPLGAGGMGEVYLAEDTRLRRRVALKVLPARLATDELARRRLLREAQSAAALDHPNICTIYEAGEADGQGFIAMQYVEGETLAARLKQGPLDLTATVAMACQVAQALAAAHRQGIVHRDIKPQNIMIAPSGQVKVLDFGLAKAAAPNMSDTRTATMLTESGMVAGTAPYMSPEQVRAEALDERSDVFSFGTVLYETAAHRHPFDGASPAETVSMILMRDAPPLDASVPPEIRRIIQKCLEKDRERRYQTVRDLVIDLEAVTRTSATAAAGPLARRAGSPLVWVTAGGLILAAVVLVPRFWRLTSTTPAPPVFQQVTAFADSASGPALSPDGRMIAFIRDPNPFMTSGDIYVKLLPDGDALRLTRDPRPKYGLAFSPDGSRLAYTLLEGDANSTQWSTWTVPVLGGQAPTRLLPNASGLSWIDERRVLFSEIEGPGLHMGLVTATETRQNSRALYFPQHERAMAHFSAMSPDRNWVLVVEMNKTGGWEPCRVLPFDGSSTGRLVGPDAPCRAAAWSPDGRWMFFAAETAGTSHLWRQPFPTGSAQAITSGAATDEQGIAMAPDGRSIITSVGRRGSSLWLHEARGDRLLTPEGFASRPRLSSDGTHVYCLLQRNSTSSASELAVVDLETGKTDRVLPDFPVSQFDVSRDDKDVVFTTTGKNGDQQVWITALDRRAPPRLLLEGADFVFFGAGQELVFRSLEGHANFLDRINRDGTGRGRILSTPIIALTAMSPDGEWAIVQVPGRIDDSVTESVTVSVRGGTVRRICLGLCSVVWSPDVRFLALGIFRPPGQTVVVPLARGQIFPPFPADGSAGMTAWTGIAGAQTVQRAGIVPGLDGSTYVFRKNDDLRNLFRVSVQ